jgi:hypothetical protein
VFLPFVGVRYPLITLEAQFCEAVLLLKKACVAFKYMAPPLGRFDSVIKGVSQLSFIKRISFWDALFHVWITFFHRTTAIARPQARAVGHFRGISVQSDHVVNRTPTFFTAEGDA